MKTRRDLQEITALIADHLRSRFIYNESAPWALKKSPLGGVGVFATRNIDAGEVIFRDLPIILGPRAVLTSPATCVVCHGVVNLKSCSKGCGLPVCSNQCENSSVHTNECEIILKWRNNVKCEDWNAKLVECLTPIRSLFLNDFHKRLLRTLQCHSGAGHGHEVDILKNDLHMDISESHERFMRFVCSILDANAFKVIVVNDNCESALRGLYPLSSLANHRCVPNAMHVFDERHCMVVKAAVSIPKDAEIFHSYARLLWGTVTRRYHILRTKHFFCRCQRCMDPAELGTNTSAVRCNRCGGNVLPKGVAKLDSEWQCWNCKLTISSEKVGIMLSILGTWLRECDNGDPNTLLAYLKEKVLRVVPDCNEISMEMKYKLVWILGYKEGYLWAGITSCLCFSNPTCLKITALRYLFLICVAINKSPALRLSANMVIFMKSK